MAYGVSDRFDAHVPDFLRAHGVDEAAIPSSVTKKLLNEQKQKKLAQQVRQLTELPTLADQLYTLSTEFLEVCGVRIPSSTSEALSCERNQTYYAEFLYHANIHAELMEEFNFIPWLAAATRQDFSVISSAQAQTERQQKRRQLFEQVFASEDEFSNDGLSFRDFICGDGQYHGLSKTKRREKLEAKFDKLRRAVCVHQFCALIQQYLDKVISLLPKEERDSQTKIENWRHELMGRLLKLAVPDPELDNTIGEIIFSLPEEERDSGNRKENWRRELLKLAVPNLNGILAGVIRLLPEEKRDSPDKNENLRRELLRRLLAGESWLNSSFSSFDEISLKKYRPQEEPAIVLQTTSSVDIASTERVRKAVKLFAPGKESSTADNVQSKVRNNSGRIRDRWWSGKKNRPEVIYTPGDLASAEINSLSEMNEDQWAELLRLIELVKALIDSAEKDEDHYPTGRFYTCLSSEHSEESVESLVMISAIFTALKKKNPYFLRKVTWTPDPAVTLSLASRGEKSGKLRDELSALLGDPLLKLNKTFNEQEIKTQAASLQKKSAALALPKSPVGDEAKSDTSSIERKPPQLDMTTLLEKQKQPPGFASRVAGWKKIKESSVKFVLKPVAYSVAAAAALPIVIVYYGSKLLGDYLIKPLLRAPGRFVDLLKGKPEELKLEDLAPEDFAPAEDVKVKESSSAKFALKLIVYPVAAVVALPVVIVYYGLQLLGDYLIKPLLRAPGRFVDLLTHGKSERFGLEDLVSAEDAAGRKRFDGSISILNMNDGSGERFRRLSENSPLSFFCLPKSLIDNRPGSLSQASSCTSSSAADKPCSFFGSSSSSVNADDPGLDASEKSNLSFAKERRSSLIGQHPSFQQTDPSLGTV